MPLYEYKCSKCDQIFEELVNGNGEQVTCPTCGRKDCEKILSTFAVPGGPGNKSCPTTCQKGSCGTCG